MSVRSFLVSLSAFTLMLVATISAGELPSISSTQARPDGGGVSAVQSSMPVAFTKNMGQWPDSILYRADGGGGTMWFTKDGIYYQFTRRIASAKPSAMRGDAESPEMYPDKFGNELDSIETTMIKAAFVGASSEVEVTGLDELEYRCNYFIGNEPSNWHTDVPNFSGVTYRNLYPGVDASFGATDGRMECRLTATSEASLAQMQVEYLGAGSVTKESDGVATIQTAFGEMRFAGVLPVAQGETREAMKASTEAASGTWVLVYGTYLGGGGVDQGYGIAVDESGSAYVTGNTSSVDFPVLDPYQNYIAGAYTNVFVSKLTPSGNALVFSTYLGGSDSDESKDVAIDVSGNAYIVGTTVSSDFPTVNPIQSLHGRFDAFVAKLSPSGNTLLYSTYLGGTTFDGGSGDVDWGNGIAVDASGQVYVIGTTGSTDFPVQDPLQATKGGRWDAFVSKLSVDGDSLIYSTYFGGGDQDFGNDIAIDPDGNAYITGQTWSADFPLKNPFQATVYYDAFVTKISSGGDSLLYSTCLGGRYSDEGRGIALDVDGNVYIVGIAGSDDFPVYNPLQEEPGDEYDDIFLTKFSPDCSTMYFSTYLGTAGHDYGLSVGIDDAGNAYIAGTHNTGIWPVPGSYSNPQWYMNDVLVAAVTSTGDSLLYFGYLMGRYGSDANDEGYAIAIDAAGNAYLTGYTTTSSSFPILNPYQTDQVGADAFVAKLVSPSADRDSDGLLDIVDNCPVVANPGQEDSNTDGKGDACCCTAVRGNVNGSSGETPDLSDLSFLISYLTQTPRPTLPCPNEANVNGVGGIDLSDLTVMISYLTETPSPVIPNCP